MANAETTFADRLQRGRNMQAATAAFDPVFAPADVSLDPATFATFLDGLMTLNDAVTDAEANWKDEVAVRAAQTKELKTLALRVLSRVKSNSAWDRRLAAVKKAVDDLRGYRPNRKSTPPPGEGERRPARADQSYGDIQNLAKKLIAALGKVSGYDTGAPADITIAAMTAKQELLAATNTAVAGLEQDLFSARMARKMAYDYPDGLRDKMKATKQATRAQYGASSVEFMEVRSIRV